MNAKTWLGSSGPRLVWRSVLRISSAGIVLVAGAIRPTAQEFKISEVNLAPGGVVVRYEADSTRYYRLLRGEQVLAVSSVTDLKLGESRDATTGFGNLHDAALAAEAAFYRLESIPLTAPKDSDADGMDDVFELRHPSVLDALDPADAAADPDADGLSNRLEAAAGMNPTRADSDFNGVQDADEDPDGDSLTNRAEALAGTHPGRHDTDGDGLNDEAELTGGSDALDPADRPLVIASGTTGVILPAVLMDATGLFTGLAVGQPELPIVVPATGLDDDGAPLGVVVGTPRVLLRPRTPGVDLAVKVDPLSVAATEAEPEDLMVTLNQYGSTDATNVRLTMTLPPGVTVESATADNGTCQVQGSIVTCQFGTLPPAAVRTVHLELRAAELTAPANEFENLADLTMLAAADEPDASPADNTASVPFEVNARRDFGDAPEPDYPTRRWADGARHRVTATGPRLSPTVTPLPDTDTDLDGNPSSHAEGDDALDGHDDETGVVFLTELLPGEAAQVAIHFDGSPGKVDAWIDFDGGGWTASFEKILDGRLLLGTSPYIHTFIVPAWALPGQTFARFRISTAGTADPTGYAADGEVEDHWVEILGCNCPQGQPVAGNDPLLDSWFIAHAGELAEVREIHGGTLETTWRGQPTEVFADVQAIASHDGFVYIHAHGLASHDMGPWYFDEEDTELFPNLPLDQDLTVKFPAEPGPHPEVHRNTPLGVIGLWVNGTAIYNATDGFSWSRSLVNESESTPTEPVLGVDDPEDGDDIWHRSAWFAEKVTFDYALYHSPSDGQYHAHNSPAALRAQLGDNVYVLYDAVSREPTRVAEAAIPTRHSPILGWALDGFPVYGPYGYADPFDPKSGVRRMVSGYVLRNGDYGTTDLRDTGRKSLPRWSLRTTTYTSTRLTEDWEFGPPTTKERALDPSVRDPLSFELGRYLEDYEYLGDLPTGIAKPDWDLDQFNGRCCVTPEFPNGTYAYFVTIDVAGEPAFPYVLGPQYCGEASGGIVRAGIPLEANLHFDHREHDP